MNSSLGNWWAPALSAVILIAAAAFGLVGVDTSPNAEPFHDRVRTSIEAVPYKIGSWVGADVEAAAAATRLLRPVKLMQRRYSDPATGRSFNLLIVYCGDTRDMLGHYPPVCYPAHGWQPESRSESSFQIDGGRYPATMYQFRRHSLGLEQSLDIFNFFALPAGDTRLVGDMDAVNRASQTRSGVGLGAAQIQLLFSVSIEPDERREIIDAVLQAIRPTLETITEGATS